MKKIIIFCISLSLSQWAFADDKAKEIQAIVDSGQPKLELNSKTCDDDKDGADLLEFTRPFYYSGVCGDVAKLPKKVLRELWDMEDEQLENESDYDSRITKVYVFEHDGVYLSHQSIITLKKIEDLREAFNIPKTDNVRLGVMEPVKGSTFSMLNYGLTLGNHWYELEDTYVGQYLKTQIDGEIGMHIEYVEELPLYPGGGLNATYHIFLMDKKLVYVKSVWWNS